MKIFVTIGTQEPFDRLIEAVDNVASEFQQWQFVAQVSNSRYEAKHLQTFDFISPTEFNNLFSESQLIISHAGMGTIISALQLNKRIVVMPRIAKLGEHRNEHQLATAKKMEELGFVEVVNNEDELEAFMSEFERQQDFGSLHKLGNTASQSLIQSLQNFIRE